MTQGGHDVLDLDALVVSRSLDPQTIRLGGREWTLKRDLTAEQVVQFWLLINRNKMRDAVALLVGEADADAFTEIALALPSETGTPVVRRIYQAAGVLRRPDDGEQAGESSAS
jgi:hypothetical protein